MVSFDNTVRLVMNDRPDGSLGLAASRINRAPCHTFQAAICVEWFDGIPRKAEEQFGLAACPPLQDREVENSFWLMKPDVSGVGHR